MTVEPARAYPGIILRDATDTSLTHVCFLLERKDHPLLIAKCPCSVESTVGVIQLLLIKMTWEEV